MAVNLGVPVLKIGWLDFVWNHRFDPDFDATAADVIAQFSVKPFEGLRLAFLNFGPEEMDEFRQATAANGNSLPTRSSYITH